ncbi:Rhodanese-like protein [Aspergillus japonicus CBS 114.51]|uniref:Rhodanese-like protein n=1 Tax=Aspergillus japonicus CBS 114.51 TaxID=1448312 RepID=A0A8T8X6T4_ASPJA|nr:Rhodanese-like protein [Aspergillus japonicus CBS 114.51]RAH83594.1 Rhodanese-like protein [Aspergillus japonicus CBS 114.51]
MSSLLPIQRRSAAILTRAIKQAPNARRSILTGATRQLPIRPCSSSSSILRLVPQSPCQPQFQPQPQQQLRRNSTNSPGEGFKQWGFEEITTALPSTNPSSPQHQKPLILIDVREPAELTATGIIPTAVNVPLASQPDALFLTPDEFETRFGFPKPGVEDGVAGTEDTQKAAPEIVFYCKAGVRARAAAQLAVQAGYDAARVGVYEGSWLDWADRGGKVERWERDD